MYWSHFIKHKYKFANTEIKIGIEGLNISPWNCDGKKVQINFWNLMNIIAARCYQDGFKIHQVPETVLLDKTKQSTKALRRYNFTKMTLSVTLWCKIVFFHYSNSMCHIGFMSIHCINIFVIRWSHRASICWHDWIVITGRFHLWIKVA